MPWALSFQRGHEDREVIECLSDCFSSALLSRGRPETTASVCVKQWEFCASIATRTGTMLHEDTAVELSLAGGVVQIHKSLLKSYCKDLRALRTRCVQALPLLSKLCRAEEISRKRSQWVTEKMRNIMAGGKSWCGIYLSDFKLLADRSNILTS